MNSLLFTLAISNYQNLIEKAKISAKSRALRAGQALQDLEPKTYKDSGYEYTIRYGVTGDLSEDVLGFAKEQSTIAIVEKDSENSKVNKVFANSEKQKMYLLTEVLEQEDNVKVYKIQKVDALDLISRISFSSKDDPIFQKEVEVGYKWNKNGDPFVNGRPEYFYSTSNLQIGAGTYARAKVSIVLDIVLRSLSLTATLNVKAIVGAQVHIQGYHYHLKTLSIFKGNYNIPNGISFKIFGIGVGLTTDIITDLAVDDIDLNIPVDFTYYRGYIVEAEKTVSVTTGKGFIDGPVNFSMTPVKSDTTLGDLKTQLLASTFELTPRLKVGLEISLTAGLVKYLDTTVTVIPYVPIKFGFDKEECASPYLYGSIQPKLDLRFQFDGFEIKNFKILPKYDKTWNLWQSRKIMMCLVDPFRGEETSSQYSYTTDLTSYVLNPTLSINGYTFTHPMHIVELQAVSGSSVLSQTVIPWQEIPKYPQSVHPGKFLVVTDPPKGFIWRFKAKQANNYILFKSYTNMKTDFTDIMSKNLIRIKEDDSENSAGIIVHPNTIAGRTIPLGKEYKVSDEDKFVAFNAHFDGEYTLLQRYANKEFAVKSNHFMTSAIASENDTYNDFKQIATKTGYYCKVSFNKMTVTKSFGSKGIHFRVNRLIGYSRYPTASFILGKLDKNQQIVDTPAGTYYGKDLGMSDWNFVYHSVENSEFEFVVSVNGGADKTTKLSHATIVKSGSVTITFDGISIVFNLKQVDVSVFADVPKSVKAIIPVLVKDVISTNGLFTTNSMDGIGNYFVVKCHLGQGRNQIPKRGKQIPYLPIYSDGFTPVTEHIVIDDKFFLVRITAGMFPFAANDIYIPMRANPGKMARKLQLYEPFISDVNGGYDYDIDEMFVTSFKPAIIVKEGQYCSIHDGTTSGQFKVYKLANVKITDDYSIVYAPIFEDSSVTFVQTYFDIHENVSSVDFRTPSALENILELVHYQFNSKRASKGFLFNSNGKKMMSFDFDKKLWSPQPWTTYTLVPICNNEEDSFCAIPLTFKPHTITYLTYEHPDGLNSYEEDIMKFQRGVIGEQIVNSGDSEITVDVWKTWKGKIQIDISNYGEYDLEITRDSDKLDNITFAATMNKKKIRADQNYVSDNFDNVIKALGVTGRAQYVNLNDKEFALSFPRSEFSPSDYEEDCSKIAPIFGLDAEKCKSIKYTSKFGKITYDDVDNKEKGEDINGRKKSVWIVLTVVGCAVVAAAVIVAGIVLIRRKRKQFKEVSTESLVSPMII
ncbi:hypothetical protein TVAG_416610 [Trichomonas vaginalis G3]|uniref:Uncharacterized protein n=1 Tax=Trichomonas vaginalis (strain ATCC PRA-98 / G3) TaxID=412133 RepID=A2EQQ3_TRIV3|nr:hypothetical protein TVAGG3_0894190 [Trichomonas vaginalis G3]EAY05018.1 hypothetical protein TVAG_416610 [Trichomonas vaginalis G3]KAI5502940.1 hypothetical protein TVAGG3_0894190 [Trichomonas vaginalis G3]|eukprot:XP_001317241.1 hypothetical protein [Trichomonas vaginalis G3]